MKKISFIIILIAGLGITGFAQNMEVVLKANKWYATGIFDGKNITLSKTAPAKSDWDAKFVDNGIMNYCSNVPNALINVEGLEVKKGDYYCDPSYTYELKGDLLHIKYPLVEWYYKVKTLAGGELQLIFVSPSEVKKSSTK